MLIKIHLAGMLLILIIVVLIMAKNTNILLKFESEDTKYIWLFIVMELIWFICCWGFGLGDYLARLLFY